MTTTQVPGSIYLTGSAAFKDGLTMALSAGIPTVCAIAGGILLLTGTIGITGTDVGLALFMYVITGIGITAGFHRLFAHRSYEASRGVQAVLAVCGMMALQGTVTGWTAGHRRHHRYSDEDGDPHSPVALHLGGPFGALKALWYVHLSRIFLGEDTSRSVYAADLLKNPLIVRLDRLVGLWLFLSLAIPFVAGALLGGSLERGLQAMLWAGPVRIFVGHHVGSCVNSVCHMWGTIDFQTTDRSRNNFLVALGTFGEGWHNNHHAFPASARQGLTWWQLDASWVVISALKALGLAWNVKVPTPEMLEQRRVLPTRLARPLALERG